MTKPGIHITKISCIIASNCCNGTILPSRINWSVQDLEGMMPFKSRAKLKGANSLLWKTIQLIRIDINEKKNHYFLLLYRVDKIFLLIWCDPIYDHVTEILSSIIFIPSLDISKTNEDNWIKQSGKVNGTRGISKW